MVAWLFFFTFSLHNNVDTLGYGKENVNNSQYFEKFNSTSHFQYAHIRKMCDRKITNWDEICKSHDTNVCGVRPTSQIKEGTVQGDMEHKDFRNWCYMFLSNMCESPTNEYSITSDTDCESYLAHRRNEATAAVATGSVDKSLSSDASVPTDASLTTDSSTDGKNNVDNNATETNYEGVTETTAIDEQSEAGLRSGKTSPWPEYPAPYVFDNHNCPYSCPDAYDPHCLTVNRGKGLYMKIFTFTNHCKADLYVCKNINDVDFQKPGGPPKVTEFFYDGYAKIDLSPLSWSHCAAYKYMQFARFTESASGLNHYGWLSGDFPANHILSPEQRLPGFG